MKRRAINTVVLLPVIVAATMLLHPWHRDLLKKDTVLAMARVEGERPDGTEAQRLIFLLQYIGNDYALAVNDGRVVSEFEYREMQDFATELTTQYAAMPRPSGRTLSALSALRSAIDAKEDPEAIHAMCQLLVTDLIREAGVVPFPRTAPDPRRGRELYGLGCAPCHGADGGGRTAVADTLDPRPRDFTDASRVAQMAPYQFYQAITLGVEGTAMASFRDAFSDEDRWSLAFFLTSLRRGFGPAKSRPGLALDMRSLATKSDRQLLEELRSRESGRDLSDGELQAAIDHQRWHVPSPTFGDHLSITRALMGQSLEALASGDRQVALDLALDGYLQGFESVEPHIRTSDKVRYEDLLSRYRAGVRDGDGDAAEHGRAMLALLDEMGAEGGGDLREETEASGGGGLFIGSGFDFLQSLTIILREGMEAALLLTLLLAFTSSAGLGGMRRLIWSGALAGVTAGGVTWVLAQNLLAISTLNREVLEGIISLLAALVLFTICLWIIHHADVARWKTLMRRQAEKAAGGSGGMALALTAFLAVYREAFETVLFYQALWLRTGSSQGSILFGLAVGAVGVAIVCALVFRFGRRLALKPFFTVTGWLLTVLALTFAGAGVRALQLTGWVPETFLPWNISLPLLEVYPTLETMGLQMGILTAIVLGLLMRRRSRLVAAEA